MLPIRTRPHNRRFGPFRGFRERLVQFAVMNMVSWVLLLHRHALGQIARLIDVGALEHGDVIREQLQRNREHDRRLQSGRHDAAC